MDWSQKGTFIAYYVNVWDLELLKKVFWYLWLEAYEMKYR